MHAAASQVARAEYARFLPSRTEPSVAALGMTTSPARKTVMRWLLGSMPLSAIAFEQSIGFFWPPASGSVLGNGSGFGGAPQVENRVDERTSGFDAVAAIEQSGVAAQAIVDQGSVRAARRIAKSFLVAETHVDVANAHFGARTLGTKRNRDTLVGLNVQDQAVRVRFAAAENDVGSALELNDDFGGALGEALAGAEIKRDIGPAPVVDEKFCGDESFRARLRADVLFLAIAGDRLAGDGSLRVLAADDRLSNHFQIEGANGLQDFQFLVAHGGGVEGSGRLNGDQRSELQNMALNHVAQRAGSFVKAAAAFDTEGFGRGDLHVVHVIAVPERFEDAVAETENQKILHRVFAEIVVDAIDLLLFENIVNNLVEFVSASQVASEGFLDDDAPPGFCVRGAR